MSNKIPLPDRGVAGSTDKRLHGGGGRTLSGEARNHLGGGGYGDMLHRKDFELISPAEI